MSAKLNDMRAALFWLEEEMRALGWWETTSPSAQALNSQEPFCIDYLRFSQWLQWVYCPKMQAYMNQYARLPSKSNLLAIAEEAWKGSSENVQRLLDIVALLDALVEKENYQEQWEKVLPKDRH